MSFFQCCFSIADTYRCTSHFLPMVARLRRRSELWQATRGECKGHWRCGWTQWCDPWRNHFVFGRCQMLPKVMSHQKNQTLLLLTSAESIQCEKEMAATDNWCPHGHDRQCLAADQRILAQDSSYKECYESNLAQWQDLDARSSVAVAVGEQFSQKPV